MTFALALAAAVAAQPCDWTHRGRDPYVGTMTAAVERYRDIQPDVQRRLATRMERHQYDEVVPIRRDGAVGYGPLYDMHWGAGRVCRGPVWTGAWAAHDEEIGLVYCEAEHCLIVPTVCRNVSRIPPKQRAEQRMRSLAVPDADQAVAPPLGVFTDAPQTFLVDDPVMETKTMRSLSAPSESATVPVSLSTIGAGLVTIPAWSAFGPYPQSATAAFAGPAPGAFAQVAPVPEPSTLGLLAMGLALVGLAIWLGRREP